MVLGVENYFFHGFDGLERVFTIRGFVGKHNDVSALDNGGSNIGNFGTGWLGRVDH